MRKTISKEEALELSKTAKSQQDGGAITGALQAITYAYTLMEISMLGNSTMKASSKGTKGSGTKRMARPKLGFSEL